MKPKVPVLVAMARTAVLVGITWLCTVALIDVAVRELPRSWVRPGWPYGYMTHAVQTVVALAIMAILKPDFPGSFGLAFPKTPRHVWPALWIGAASGVCMLIVDYYPALISGRAPAGPYDPTLGNIVPWLLMQGIFVGLAEETTFRSLFLGYFRQRMPEQVRLGRYQVSLAGVIIAVLFSLAHVSAFWHVPFPSALGQQVYATALGIFYAYLFEQSSSVLVPALAHNAGDFVEWSLSFTIRAMWPR